MKSIIARVLLIGALIISSAQASADVRKPEEVVKAYISAFREKDKMAMLGCLSDAFFEDFKTNYLTKIESYDDAKLKAAFEIYGVSTIRQIKEMSGAEIFSKFLDAPSSASYWKSFDSLEVVVEVERIEIVGDQAAVRSWLYTKKSLPVKVETIYSLGNRNGEWRIDRFSKKTLRPNAEEKN